MANTSFSKLSTKSVLPVGRINTIMKSSSDVETVSRESAVIMSKATELFIRTLTQEGYAETDQGKKLDYKHLAEIVHADEKYNFLKDILPKKITVLEYKKILAKKQAAENGGSDGDSSSETESSSDEDGSSSDKSSSSSSGKDFQKKK